MPRYLCVVLLCLLLLSGCRVWVEETVRGRNLAYLLVGLYDWNMWPRNNSLTVFDADTLKVMRKVKLPRSHAYAGAFARDPEGRIWIAFSGGLGQSDDRVMVFSPDGKLLRTIRAREYPGMGITFARGKAFIGCLERGFGGSVVVVDLDTLEVERVIPLKHPEAKGIYALTYAAATEEFLVVTVSLGDENTEIIGFDLQMGKIRERIRLAFPTTVWHILPIKSHLFYLVNNAGFVDRPYEEGEAPSYRDCLVFDARQGKIVREIDLPDLLYRGVKVGDTIYFLNVAQAATNDWREGVTIYQIKDGSYRYIELPGHMWMQDIAYYRGAVYLAGKDGLYRLDLESEELELVLKAEDATGVIFP